MREAAARGPCAAARSEVQLALCMPTLPCPVTSILTPLEGSRPRFIPATRTTRSPRPLIAPSSSTSPPAHTSYSPTALRCTSYPSPACLEEGWSALEISKAAAFARMRGIGRGRKVHSDSLCRSARHRLSPPELLLHARCCNLVPADPGHLTQRYACARTGRLPTPCKAHATRPEVFCPPLASSRRQMGRVLV